MKKFVILTLTIATSGCNMFSAGTLGTFKESIIPTPEKKVEAHISNFFKQNPQYITPEEWQYLDSWEESGYGILNGKIFYFRSKPKEMYYVTYHQNKVFQDNPNDTTTIISVRAVYDGNSSRRWNTVDDYKDNKSEIKRIENRFSEEIVKKLEIQMHVKMKTHSFW